ncbi:facilitated trehalose transporter Tret1 isoform X1 [Diachasma alloeum]|uniref:facilitated trehalose transporter Tret1 isoform X1 n=1 Tax=Diachasma alloeum TaxID=454923 RepID=UPI00073842FA|nr:facilitated trehalose transporter Tret1 isoform X1 [Diachasma alloeum]XP_015117427.1 facilitated trehalose transporter Tret1 isoform X1 [Diachasma alloeum]XP_015117428.1 facilitated trehalose transporter Tret1 isoform X1 [Diachasma alloeum]XP_028982162.1 facilitated trehalose transporter Tret1 isoform X1 [Diachasma alloeum]
MTAVEKTLWPQWLAGFTVSLAVLTASLANGWASPFLAKLISDDVETTFKITPEQGSWVASLLSLGRVLGAIAGAVCQGTIGRKKTMLVGTLPLTFGWMCMIFAKSVEWLYVGRLCNGLGSGMIWGALSLYMGEIADPSIRGSLIFLNLNASSMGSLLGNAMGPFLDLKQYGYVAVSLAAAFIILFSWIPESPYHYILQGDFKRAEASLLWYKRHADAPKEINELKEFVGSANSDSESFKNKLKVFCKLNNAKNMAIVSMLNLFLYCGGHNVISSYAEIIMRKSDIQITPSIVVIALGVIMVIAGAVAMIFVDRCGRRPLLIYSSFGVCFSMVMLGIHFNLLAYGVDPDAIDWLPILALCLYNFALPCGMLSMPNTLLGELFPPTLKTIASLTFTCSAAFISFCAIRAFQPVLDLVGERIIFFMIASAALCVAPFTYFLVPETKGKTLIEIQKNMDSKKKDVITRL